MLMEDNPTNSDDTEELQGKVYNPKTEILVTLGKCHKKNTNMSLCYLDFNELLHFYSSD